MKHRPNRGEFVPAAYGLRVGRCACFERGTANLCLDEAVRHERAGTVLPASGWFRFAEPQMSLRALMATQTPPPMATANSSTLTVLR